MDDVDFVPMSQYEEGKEVLKKGTYFCIQIIIDRTLSFRNV